MMMVSLLFLFALETGTFDLESTLRLDAIPDTEEAFLQGPRDITIDGQGRFWVLDLVAKRLFVWDRDGTFLQSVGREGQGPGEFNFRASMGGSQGYVNAVRGKIMVYDGGNRVVHEFGEDFAFQRTVRFNIPAGRAEQFRVLNDGRYLVFNSSYSAAEPFRQIAIYQDEETVNKSFIKAADQTWRYTNSSRNGVILHIYSPSLFMHYDASADQILIGNSAQPRFSVYGSDGNLRKEFTLKLPRVEVTKEDIQEYEEQDWLKRSTFFKAEYADEKAFYDQVFPVGKRGFLVFNESPVQRKCAGFWVDGEGEIRGRFSFDPGDGGRLMATHGRLFAVTTNEDGDFDISEMKPDVL